MATDQALLEENARLQRRVDELTSALEAERRKAADASATLAAQAEELVSRDFLLQEILDANPALIVIRDLSGKIVATNKAYDAFLAASRSELIGKTYDEFLSKAMIDMVKAMDAHVLSTGQTWEGERVYPLAGGPRIHQARRFPIRNRRGDICALGGVSTDITDQRRAEEERQRANEELAQQQARIIEAQRTVLREISTPLIPLSSSVVLMPLVGTIDAQRAAQAMQALLTGIEKHRATVAILDVTGVHTVDRTNADGLVRAAQAARLLGTEVIVTGVQPRTARIFVELGVDLRGIVTLSTLEEAIAYATGRRERA